jgi:hypothetical protein
MEQTQGSPLFDRAAFVERVRTAFGDVEALLQTGDAFDYEEAALFSGIVNGSQEHVVVVPLTQASVSTQLQKTLGTDQSWKDISSLPLFGFYMLSPTDCIHTLDPDTAYLVRAISWERAELVAADGSVSRLFVIWAQRGDPTPAYYEYRGNVKIHIDSCWTASSNQI